MEAKVSRMFAFMLVWIWDWLCRHILPDADVNDNRKVGAISIYVVARISSSHRCQMRHQCFFLFGQMHYYVVACQVIELMLKLYGHFITPIDVCTRTTKSWPPWIKLTIAFIMTTVLYLLLTHRKYSILIECLVGTFILSGNCLFYYFMGPFEIRKSNRCIDGCYCFIIFYLIWNRVSCRSTTSSDEAKHKCHYARIFFFFVFYFILKRDPKKRVEKKTSNK